MNAGWGISPWNLVDFNHEIWWISPRFDLWNPPKLIKASVSAKTLQFDECRVGLWPRISWNPPYFTLKSGGFHLWNPAEFTQISSMKSTQNYKSKCFSKNSSVWWMQGGGYDQGFHEIRMKSAGFHVKSGGFQLKSGGFHEIRRISREIERPFARNCNPMFRILVMSNRCSKLLTLLGIFNLDIQLDGVPSFQQPIFHKASSLAPSDFPVVWSR